MSKTGYSIDRLAKFGNKTKFNEERFSSCFTYDIEDDAGAEKKIDKM